MAGTVSGSARKHFSRSCFTSPAFHSLKSFAAGSSTFATGTNVSSAFALMASFGRSASVAKTRRSFPSIFGKSASWIFAVSPFETLDRDGVGSLVRYAVEKGRGVRPDLHLGVCGEHGGDPESIHFFEEVGLDYVSCSPFRVPVARLEAGRANRG